MVPSLRRSPSCFVLLSQDRVPVGAQLRLFPHLTNCGSRLPSALDLQLSVKHLALHRSRSRSWCLHPMPATRMNQQAHDRASLRVSVLCCQ